jgi:hypothetical protein
VGRSGVSGQEREAGAGAGQRGALDILIEQVEKAGEVKALVDFGGSGIPCKASGFPISIRSQARG